MRRLCWLFLYLLWAPWVWAQAPEKVHFRGEVFLLKSVKVGERCFLPLDDPEVKRLIQATSAVFQNSTSGTTLYVFLPGRESYWSDGSGVFTLNGKELEAPGQFLAQPPAMERAALLEALGLRAFPSSDGAVLKSLVTQIATLAPDSVEAKVVTSAPVKFTATEPEKGLLRVELPEGAWDHAEREFQLGESAVTVSGGDGGPLVLLFRFPAFWAPRARLGLSREILITPEPRQAAGASGTLNEVIPGPSGLEWQFVLDHGVSFYWSLDPATRRLRLDFPAVNSSLPSARVLRTSSLTLTRYEVSVPPDMAFEFYQNSDQPNVLRLRMAAGKVTDLSGSACMSGYVGGCGSITLDAGHGGGDPGCCNRGLGVYEKDITLDICLRMQQLLTAQGWRVEMTRTSDRDVTYAGSPDLMELQARADVANKGATDLFVSIHCNASINSGVRGSSVYWWKPEDRGLAEYLDVLGEGLGFEQDGLIQNNFAVLRLTSMPAVLVETAFLTNPSEGRLLATPQVRQAIAERLVEGLGRYMGARNPRSRGRSSAPTGSL